jgi:ribonuclease P/MRP protein subunit POP5
MYLSTATSTAIIRVSRECYRLVWGALSFATQLPKPLSTPCVFQVLRVSGTIRKSEEAAIRLAIGAVRKATKDANGNVNMGVEMLKQGRETNPAGHGDGMDVGEDDTEDNIDDNDITDAG